MNDVMNKIETRDVNFWYGNFHALKGISMDIAEKSVVAFIGRFPVAVSLLFSAC